MQTGDMGMMRRLWAGGRSLARSMQSSMGSAMVLSAVIHVAALPLLADWNPATTAETERKVSLVELTPEEQRQLPAFARESLPSGSSVPGSSVPGSIDLFSRLGLGSGPSGNRSPKGNSPQPRNDSLLWPGAGAESGAAESNRGSTGRRWDSGAGDYQGWDSLYGRGGWQMDDSSGSGQRQRSQQRSSRRQGNRQSTGTTGQGQQQGRSTTDPKPPNPPEAVAQALATIAIQDLRASALDMAAGQALTAALTPAAGEGAGSYTYNASLVGDRAAQARLGGVADWVQKVADLPMRSADGKLLPGTQKAVNGSFRDMIQVGDEIQKTGVPIQWRQFADLRLCSALSAQSPHLVRLAALVGDRGKLAPGLNPVRLVESSGYAGIDSEAIVFLMQTLKGKTLADRPGYLIYIYTLAYPACGAPGPSGAPTPSPTPTPSPSPTPTPSPSPSP